MVQGKLAAAVQSVLYPEVMLMYGKEVQQIKLIQTAANAILQAKCFHKKASANIEIFIIMWYTIPYSGRGSTE